jgi:hypothetical protein
MMGTVVAIKLAGTTLLRGRAAPPRLDAREQCAGRLWPLRRPQQPRRRVRLTPTLALAQTLVDGALGTYSCLRRPRIARPPSMFMTPNDARLVVRPGAHTQREHIAASSRVALIAIILFATSR